METYYVNGFFERRSNAKISVEDRGFNFSDGVYELISYLDEKLIFFEKHYSRLSKSLLSLKISSPLSNKKILKLIIKRLIKLKVDIYIYKLQEERQKEIMYIPKRPRRIL